MDPVIIAALVEMAKLGLNGYFNMMRVAGKTEAEIDAMFLDERTRFKLNPPDSLPDV